MANEYKKVINKIKDSLFLHYDEASYFEIPGLDNLKVIDNAEDPKINDHDILIKIKVTGVNPIDHFVVSGMITKNRYLFRIFQEQSQVA